MIYKMSKEQYLHLRQALLALGLDVTAYINSSFGLKEEVTEIRFF
jgi:hypothetical protein